MGWKTGATPCVLEAKLILRSRALLDEGMELDEGMDTLTWEIAARCVRACDTRGVVCDALHPESV
jgi:hypothetical protein